MSKGSLVIIIFFRQRAQAQNFKARCFSLWANGLDSPPQFEVHKTTSHSFSQL